CLASYEHRIRHFRYWPLACAPSSNHTGAVNSRILVAVFFSAGLLAQAQDFGLESLPNLHDFESHRITSADPTGGNDDWRRLEPGQTLVLADIKGPGCITHFRDNI